MTLILPLHDYDYNRLLFLIKQHKILDILAHPFPCVKQVLPIRALRSTQQHMVLELKLSEQLIQSAEIINLKKEIKI